MSNPANNGLFIGRLAQDIREFANTDGSRKQLITLAVEDNFKSGPKKEVQTNFVQLENFIGSGRTAGGWDRVHKGDLIAVNFRIDAKPYEKDGQTHYPMKLVVEGFPNFLEPKSVTDKRAAERIAKEAQKVQDVAQSAPEPGETNAAAERIAALEAELAAARGAVPAAAPADYEAVAPFGS